MNARARRTRIINARKDESCSSNKKVICIAVIGVIFMLLVIAAAVIVPILLLENKDQDVSSNSFLFTNENSNNSFENASSSSKDLQTSTGKPSPFSNSTSKPVLQSKERASSTTQTNGIVASRNRTDDSISEPHEQSTIASRIASISTTKPRDANENHHVTHFQNQTAKNNSTIDSNVTTQSPEVNYEQTEKIISWILNTSTPAFIHEITNPSISNNTKNKSQTTAEEFEGSSSLLNEFETSGETPKYNAIIDVLEGLTANTLEISTSTSGERFTTNGDNLFSPTQKLTTVSSFASTSVLPTESTRITGARSSEVVSSPLSETPYKMGTTPRLMTQKSDKTTTTSSTSTQQIESPTKTSTKTLRVDSTQIIATEASTLKVVTTSMSVTTTTLSSQCGVLYDQTCYWLIRKSMNYISGRKLCRAEGGDAANIYKKKQYGLVLNYIRSSMPASRKYDDIWLGMWIMPSTREVAYNGGGKANYLDWMPTQPNSAYQRRKIYIHVVKSKYSKSQGMVNHLPQIVLTGILCEKRNT